MQGPAIQPPRPNSCTYWVSSRVLAGEHPTDRRGIETTKRKLRQYLKLGVTVFIDLTEPGQKMDYQDLLQELAMEIPESDPANSLEYYRLSVPDFDIPTVEGMQQILDTMDAAVARDKTIYVHCAGGIGRTGTTVGCYLVRHGNDGETALKEVDRLFQNSDRSQESWTSPETRQQMDFVRKWCDESKNP